MTLLAASEHITADRIFTDMHTAYRFTSEPVTDADLARVYELANAGPMGGVDLAGIDREFFAGTSLRTIMVVNLGHAGEGGTFPRNPRLTFDQAVALA